MRHRIAAGAAVLAMGAAGVITMAAPASADAPVTPRNPLGCNIGLYIYGAGPAGTPLNLLCLKF
jgi:hypothetical protein